ncbi:uncharacterized protein [Melanerpes formicivorus]|uniref:uncharacterized protein n=1 Tax=Melanerpes formicivorus TaxID=211600 RepID=UPI00358EC26B
MKDEVTGGGRRRVGAPHPPAALHARSRSLSGNGAVSPPPSPPGSSYSQAGVRGGQQPGTGRVIKRGGMKPGEGRRRGSGSARETQGGRGGGGSRASHNPAVLAGPSPLQRLAQARHQRSSCLLPSPPPQPSFTAPPLASQPTSTHPPHAPRRPAPREQRPRLGKLLAPAPPPLPDEPRWPPGFLCVEPSSDMNRKGPPPPGRTGWGSGSGSPPCSRASAWRHTALGRSSPALHCGVPPRRRGLVSEIAGEGQVHPSCPCSELGWCSPAEICFELRLRRNRTSSSQNSQGTGSASSWRTMPVTA